jgi:multidrug/hemolysin transport system permease protein
MEQAEKVTFAGAPPQILEEFRLEMGVAFKDGDTIVSTYASFLYLLFFLILFFVLSLIKFAKKEA